MAHDQYHEVAQQVQLFQQLIRSHFLSNVSTYANNFSQGIIQIFSLDMQFQCNARILYCLLMDRHKKDLRAAQSFVAFGNEEYRQIPIQFSQIQYHHGLCLLFVDFFYGFKTLYTCRSFFDNFIIILFRVISAQQPSFSCILFEFSEIKRFKDKLHLQQQPSCQSIGKERIPQIPFQFIIAKLINYIMFALNQQHSSQANPPSGSPQNIKKIDLINLNMSRFINILKLSSGISVLRLGLFIIILVYEKTFISHLSDSVNTDSWSIIFYVMTSLMDFLVIMNNTQMLKFLKYQAFRLLEIRNALFSSSNIIPSTAIGPYTNYMSIYSIVTIFKLSSRLAVSISKTVRLLQTFSTFYIFAYLAINSQSRNGASPLPIVILWGFILSIYIQIIQIDLSIVQNSSGPYIPPKTLGNIVNVQQQQSKESLLIKDVYIKKIRRPFQVAYIMNIIFILTITIIYYQSSFFNLMCGLCIIAHGIELVYEKHIQNRLMLFDLKSIPFQYLSSLLIMKYLNKQSWKLRFLIVSFTRVSIVLMIMAFFTRSSVGLVEQVVLIILNLTIYLAQKIKFYSLQQGKLYIIRSKIKEQTQKEGCDCSICLVDCQKGDRIVELPCFDSHVFHFKCMNNWFGQRKQCPLCRYSLEIYDLVK